MVSQATIDMLVGMKMTAMAAELSSQLQDSSFNELGFEDRLGLLVTAEWNRRQTNTVKRLIHNACLQCLFPGLEQSVDVGGAQGTVVQAVAGLAFLAPDHAAVVGPDVAVKAVLHQNAHNLADVQAAAGRQVCPLLKGAVLHDLHVADVHEGNAVHRRVSNKKSSFRKRLTKTSSLSSATIS